MVNKVFLIGRLGKDPVVKHFQNDNAIAEFSLATTESYKDKEGKWNDITDWHNIKLPNKFMAERAEKNLKKGNLVHIEGKLRTRSYDDKDGNKRYVTEVIVEQFRKLEKNENGGGEGGGGNYSSSNSSSQSSYNEAPVTTNNSSSPADDDLPF
ncbi:MAG: single-stranded DNA-binding protein [Chitinophagales bacterium]|nr:single-stranded DNA-binding protein [Chitinophagales bacterium]